MHSSFYSLYLLVFMSCAALSSLMVHQKEYGPPGNAGLKLPESPIGQQPSLEWPIATSQPDEELTSRPIPKKAMQVQVANAISYDVGPYLPTELEQLKLDRLGSKEKNGRKSFLPSSRPSRSNLSFLPGRKVENNIYADPAKERYTMPFDASSLTRVKLSKGKESWVDYEDPSILYNQKAPGLQLKAKSYSPIEKIGLDRTNMYRTEIPPLETHMEASVKQRSSRNPTNKKQEVYFLENQRRKGPMEWNVKDRPTMISPKAGSGYRGPSKYDRRKGPRKPKTKVFYNYMTGGMSDLRPLTIVTVSEGPKWGTSVMLPIGPGGFTDIIFVIPTNTPYRSVTTISTLSETVTNTRTPNRSLTTSFTILTTVTTVLSRTSVSPILTWLSTVSPSVSTSEAATDLPCFLALFLMFMFI